MSTLRLHVRRRCLIVALPVLFSCNSVGSSDPACNFPIAIEHLETKYGCVDTPHRLSINLVNNFTVVHNQEEFDRLTDGCSAAIDFNAYDLVIGKRGLPSLLDTITYTLKRRCETNGLELEVSIATTLATQPDNVTYHSLIPKLEQEAVVIRIVLDQ